MVCGPTDQEDIMTQTLPSQPNIDGEWPEQGTWTYDDYARLPDDGRRYEVIKGVLYMAPSPNTGHQYASGRLGNAMYTFVEQHQLGRVYFAPYRCHSARAGQSDSAGYIIHRPGTPGYHQEADHRRTA